MDRVHYRTKVKEFADERGLTLDDLYDSSGIARNTVNAWYYNGPISQLHSKVLIAFQRVFNIPNWQDLIEPILYDGGTGDVVDPFAQNGAGGDK